MMRCPYRYAWYESFVIVDGQYQWLQIAYQCKYMLVYIYTCAFVLQYCTQTRYYSRMLYYRYYGDSVNVTRWWVGYCIDPMAPIDGRMGKTCTFIYLSFYLPSNESCICDGWNVMNVCMYTWLNTNALIRCFYFGIAHKPQRRTQ